MLITFAFLLITLFSIQDVTATTYTCSNCSNCSNTIQNIASQQDLVLLTENIIDANGTCIDFAGIDNVTFDCQSNIIDGDADATGTGIYFTEYAMGNVIQNCVIQEFNDGIYSLFNNVEGNNISNVVLVNNTNRGIFIDSASYWVYDNLSFIQNKVGLAFHDHTDSNIVINSYFMGNRDYDFYIGYSTSDKNVVYNNTFRNKVFFEPNEGINYWNNSVYGNHWLNYDSEEEGCFDTNTDGFCDDTHIINGFATDYKPKYTNQTTPEFNCSDCAECNNIISNNSLISIGILVIESDITNVDGNCISIPAYVKNIHIDCQGNKISGDGDSVGTGIKLIDFAENSHIENCILEEFQNGMYYPSYSHYHLIENTCANNNTNYGFYMDGILDSVFINLTAIDNPKGFALNDHTDRNNITQSYFVGNSENDFAIWASSSDSNYIYNNTFQNKSFMDIDIGANIWNNSVTGNHWLSFDSEEEGCYDVSPQDGFCDTNYTISEYGVDFLPIALSTGITIPSMQSSKITPLTPNVDDALIGYCNASDSGEDKLSYYYRWYLEDSLNTSGYNDNSGNNFTQGIEINIANISSSLTAIGDNWTLSCLASDGTNNASDWNNITVTILDISSNVTDVVLSSSSGNNLTTDNLSVTFTSTNSENYFVKNITDWRLNENSVAVLNMPFEYGSTNSYTKDYSSFDNQINSMNAEWNKSSGYDGRGVYYFNGTTDIQIEDSASLNITDNLTISLWVKPANLLDAQIYIVKGSIVDNYNYEFGQYLDNIYFGVGDDEGESVLIAESVLSDLWQHFVVTISNRTIVSFYKNSTYLGSGTLSADVVEDTTGKLFIGSELDSNYYFEGYLDDIQIFDRTLSLEQIREIYDSETDNHSLNKIVPNETRVGEEWTVAVTPNALSGDGETVLSNTLTIVTEEKVLQFDQLLTDKTIYHTENLTYDINCSGGGTIIYSDNTSLFNINSSTGLILDDPTENDVGIHSINITCNNGTSSVSDYFNYSILASNSWHIFHGNVTGKLGLGTTNEMELIQWVVNNLTNSNIFIADSDSSINFNNLHAVGRDLSNNAQFDDFYELDVLLGTENAEDSINKSYTSSGSPITTTTFTVYGSNITNVAIIDSSNNSNFTTGILWDSYDDSSNEEFDSTDKEDVVFITKVKENTQSQYGTFDYEIKIPANLKTYLSDTATYVSLYTEISPDEGTASEEEEEPPAEESGEWDFNTAVYSTEKFYFGGEEEGAKHVFFKPDGTKMYIVGEISLKVLQYSLSDPWDVTSASYDSVYYDINDGGETNPQITDPKGLVFKPDGTKIYITSSWESPPSSLEKTFEYDLTSAWDLSSVEYNGDYHDWEYLNINAHGLYFKSDGTKMYLSDYGLEGVNPAILEFDLSTAWNVSTASYDDAILNCTNELVNRLESFYFSSDGTKLFAVTRDTYTRIVQYNFSTPWDVTSGNYGGIYVDYTSEPVSTGSTGNGCFIKPDGKEFYLLNNYDKSIHKITLGLDWTLYFAYYSNYVSVLSETGDSAGVVLSSDGTKMFVNSYAGVIYEYDLRVAGDVRSAIYNSVSFNFGGTEANQRGMTSNSDGSKLYIVGSQTDNVYEIDLSSSWDLSTASYTAGHYIDVYSQTGNYPLGIAISNDGTKMYLNNLDENLYEYTLSSPGDVTSATYTNNLFSYSAQDSEGRGININDDGTKFYAIGDSTDDIYQYNLTTAYNISTAVYDTFIDTTEDGTYLWEGGPRGITFDSTGETLYLVGNDRDRVWQIDIN